MSTSTTDLEEENLRKELEAMRAYKIGGTDKSGSTITHIYVNHNNFVVYSINTTIPSESLKTHTVGNNKAHDRDLEERFDKIRENYAKMKGKLYKVQNDSSLPSRIAHAVSHALTADAPGANRILENLIKEVDDEFRERFRNRAILLCSSFLVGFVLSIFSAAYIVYQYYGIPWHPPHVWLFVMTASAIGGFLSVSYRMGNVEFVDEAPGFTYWMYGIERSVVAVISGVIVYCAMKGDFLLGFLKNDNVFVVIILAVIAGFSESFIPTLLANLEKKAGKVE